MFAMRLIRPVSLALQTLLSSDDLPFAAPARAPAGVQFSTGGGGGIVEPQEDTAQIQLAALQVGSLLQCG